MHTMYTAGQEPDNQALYLVNLTVPCHAWLPDFVVHFVRENRMLYSILAYGALSPPASLISVPWLAQLRFVVPTIITQLRSHQPLKEQIVAVMSVDMHGTREIRINYKYHSVSHAG